MSNSPTVSSIDSEFKGSFAKALSGNGKQDFELLLAMLQQDITDRLRITSNEEPPKDTRELELESINFYPEIPLSIEEKHWKQQHSITQAAAELDFSNVRLMQYMFPTPLALQNDPARIPDDVLANCDIFCQQRMAGEQTEEINVDETLLYDVIKNVRDNFSVDQAA